MEQLSFNLNDFEGKEKDINSLANAREAFGCCHRYRQCSNAGICIVPDDPDATNCVYRLNLTNGKIFYGKNANEFDIDVYNNIKNTYLSLNSDVKEELDCLIIYYEKHRSSVLWYNSDKLEKLKEMGFCEYIIPKNMILKLYKLNFLRRFVNNETIKLLDEAERKRKNDEKVRAKKSAYVKWLIQNPVPKLENMLLNFAYVSFPANISKYIFELHYDFLRIDDRSDKYKQLIIKHLPRENEVDFVKPKPDKSKRRKG